MFDAYNIKKVLPRLVVAVILIQLSWFIFTALIRLTAVVAYGLEGLMYAPFGGRDQIAFSEILSNSNVNGGSGLFLAAVGVAGFAALYLGVAFSLALTALIGLFVGFLTLLVRQVVLITLLVLSPLALVAWILPGTQKFWKLWWESFSKLLLMFPMIVVLVAGGRIVAYISAQVSGVDTNNLYGSTQIGDIAFLAIITIGYFGPFFLIPKTFQLAGSAFGNITGMVNDRSRGVFDRLKKGRQQTSASAWERKGQRKLTQARADMQSRLQTQGSNRNRFIGSRLAAKAGARVIGGYNIQALQSAKQAQVGKELNDQIATGRDEEIRGLTVNKKAATLANGLMREKNGVREYKTLGGAWVTEAAVDRAYSRWGNDTYAQQTALSYEMRKAMTDDQVTDIGKRYQTLARGAGGWGMTENQAIGSLKGSGFENQNQHLEFKHMNLDGTLNKKAFVEEAFQKKGTYPLSQMSGHTIEQLKQAHAEAVIQGDTDTANKVASIAESFVARGGLAGGVGALDADGNPIPGIAAGGAGGTAVQTNAPGAAAVAEKVRELAVQTGVYQNRPSGDPKPQDWNIPPPPIKPLN